MAPTGVFYFVDREAYAVNYENIIMQGDCIEKMRELPEEIVNTCVTSPPYFGLRDYGVDGQIGLEETPDAYVSRLVDVFREVRRVLRDDGTLWLNLGDSYNSMGGTHAGRDDNQSGVGAGGRQWREWSARADGRIKSDGMSRRNRDGTHAPGLKAKDLIGIPWRVAFALQADGWYLRQDIIWHKPNPMPESVTDRCTKSHEYIFLFAKSERYYFDNEAIKEEAIQAGRIRSDKLGGEKGDDIHHSPGGVFTGSETRNKRDVWTVATKPYSGAHFATFPPDLITPCILAGCPPGGIVLDPFMGSGTTASVSVSLGIKYIGTELNPEYIELARKRISETQPPLEGFQ